MPTDNARNKETHCLDNTFTTLLQCCYNAFKLTKSQCCYSVLLSISDQQSWDLLQNGYSNTVPTLSLCCCYNVVTMLLQQCHLWTMVISKCLGSCPWITQMVLEIMHQHRKDNERNVVTCNNVVIQCCDHISLSQTWIHLDDDTGDVLNDATLLSQCLYTVEMQCCHLIYLWAMVISRREGLSLRHSDLQERGVLLQDDKDDAWVDATILSHCCYTVEMQQYCHNVVPQKVLNLMQQYCHTVVILLRCNNIVTMLL